MEYTSRGVGNAALTTGIIGTALGAMSSAGGLAGILGVGHRDSGDPGDKPVTRYEMGLFQQINDKNDEITLLKANQYSDNKDLVLQAQINQQAVWNAAAMANMGNINQQIQQLFGITKLMIPDNLIVPPLVAASSTSSGT